MAIAKAIQSYVKPYVPPAPKPKVTTPTSGYSPTTQAPPKTSTPKVTISNMGSIPGITTTKTSGGGGGSSGGGSGSYNPGTGTYTSPTGVQQSMAVAPVGARVVTGGISTISPTSTSTQSGISYVTLTPGLQNSLSNLNTKSYTESTITGTPSSAYRDTTIYAPGTLYTAPTGNFDYNGQQVPTRSNVFYVGSDWSSSPATPAQSQEYYKYVASKNYETTILTPQKTLLGSTKIATTYGETKGYITKLAAEPVIDIQATRELSSQYGMPGQIVGGFFEGAVGTKGALIGTAASFGLGGAFTIGSKALGIAALSIPKYGGLVSSGVRVGEYGLGTYMVGSYGLQQVTAFEGAKGAYAKSMVVGSTGINLGAGIAGGYAGSKAFDIGYGRWQTRGMKDITKVATNPLVESGQRRFVEISKSEFSKLQPIQKAQLDVKLFKSKTEVAKALGTQQGGIHATGASNSDFSQLTRAFHIAPEASTQFLDITSGGGYKLFPSFKDITSPISKPGLIFVETPGGIKPLVGYEYPRGTYNWKGELGSGLSAYAPGTKPEIQAAFDPRVTLGFESIPFNPSYIETHGVKVPFAKALRPIVRNEEIPKDLIKFDNKIFESYSPYKSRALLESPYVFSSQGYSIPTSSYSLTTTSSSFPSSTPTSSYTPPSYISTSSPTSHGGSSGGVSSGTSYTSPASSSPSLSASSQYLKSITTPSSSTTPSEIIYSTSTQKGFLDLGREGRRTIAKVVRTQRPYKYQASLSQVLIPGMKFKVPKEMKSLGYSPLAIRGFEGRTSMARKKKRR